ncbi:MAG: 16S rRNA (guanine(966)-N(2))-methyltransferase RsmD [Ilumatobacteraceae bacterium]
MRIVAGTLRGRRIEAPEGTETRPTTDRVREAVFNALGSLDLLVDAQVADLFAGSGALGIEALSRGAAHCWFVEKDRRAIAVLRRNLADLGLEAQATVVPADAATWVRGMPAVDLVLADPPYQFEGWAGLLGEVRAPFVVAEADRAIEPTPGWDAQRTKRYGRTHVTFLGAVD